MKIKLSRSANKFLEKLDRSSREAVIAKIGILKTCLETQKIYLPEELDIKKLKGNLSDFLEFTSVKFASFFKFVERQMKFSSTTLTIKAVSTL